MDNNNQYYCQSDAGQIEKYTTQVETPYRMYQDRDQVDVNLAGSCGTDSTTT